MSKLTVTEKEHWKQRVERRIDRAIEELSLQHPTFMPALKSKARRQVLMTLNIEDIYDQSDTINHKINQLEEERKTLDKQIFNIVVGEGKSPYYSVRSDIEDAIDKHQNVLEDQLLAESDTGRAFLNLRRERDELLDTIWLATSNRQIRDLWSRVSEVLSEESTPLQNQILAESE